jgi:hypothetical protein
VERRRRDDGARLLARASFYRMQLGFLGAVPVLFEHCFRDRNPIESRCRCARREGRYPGSFDEASFKITNALFLFSLASRLARLCTAKNNGERIRFSPRIYRVTPLFFLYPPFLPVLPQPSGSSHREKRVTHSSSLRVAGVISQPPG